MTSDSAATDHRPRLAPNPAPRRWGLRDTVAALGVAAVIAALGGAAIYAATGHPGAEKQAIGTGMPPGPPPGTGGQAPTMPTALHGEFVVSDDTGGYLTVMTQHGTATEVSPTSVTVRSADGFTQRYVVPPGAQPDRAVAANDEVDVRARRIGQTATLTAVSQQPPSSN